MVFQKSTQDYLNKTDTKQNLNSASKWCQKSCVRGKGIGKTQNQSGLLGLNSFVTRKCFSKQKHTF